MRITRLSLVLLLAACGCGSPGAAGVPVTPPRESGPQYVEPQAAPVVRLAVDDASPPQPPAPAATAPVATQPVQAAAPLSHASTAASRPAGIASTLPPAALKVNDATVALDDLMRAAREKLRAASTARNEAAFRQQAATILKETLYTEIGNVLIFPEADKRLGDEQKKDIDKEVADARREIISRFGGTRAAADAVLARDRTNLEEVLKDYRRQVIVSTFLRAKFYPSVNISRRDMWDYYQSHQEQFASPAKVQMQIIASPLRAFLPPGADDPSATELDAARTRARENIDAAAAALKAGDDFDKVAARYTRGPKADSAGLWPLMPAGSFRDAKVEEAAFALPQGGVSGVLETEVGFYIVKARQVVPGSVQSFEQAQEAIEQQLRQSGYRKMADEYYQKLFKEAVMGDAEKFLTGAVATAVERYWPGGRDEKGSGTLSASPAKQIVNEGH
jgi:parvulin-like peptidyl-prolyl isomerase